MSSAMAAAAAGSRIPVSTGFRLNRGSDGTSHDSAVTYATLIARSTG